MGRVVPLQPRLLSEAPRPMPERLSPAEKERLLHWAAARGYSLEELGYATSRVRDWARSRAKEPQKRDWVRAVQNALRDGWALRGFAEEQKRRGRTKRTLLTKDVIEQVLARAIKNTKGTR